MKSGSWLLLLALFCCRGLAAAHAQLPDGPQALLDQARRNGAQQSEQARAFEQRFLAEPDLQQRRIDEAKAALEAEKRRTEVLQKALEQNERRIAELDARERERAGPFVDLLGAARQGAAQARALFEDSLISTQIRGRQALMDSLAQGKGLPSVKALEQLWLALLQEMTESGKVASYPASVIATDGAEQARRVTRIGVFTAVADGRFLRVASNGEQLAELTRQPEWHFQRLASELERSQSGIQTMIIDPSRGAVLSLLVKMPGLIERIQQGRLIGYLTIAIAVIGLLIAIERLGYLAVIGRRIKRQIASDTPSPKNPLGRVLAVYLENREVGTETLELKLDERILRELPRLQRGLQSLRIITVIAPLLGLLGTVTGLIETFQSITLFGTGDPRLMAGGISQALVTTVLGLATAIPLILLHTIIAGKSKRLVGILEEQSAGIIAEHAQRREEHHVVPA